MATFVLVHGSLHGGWCWKKVTPLLRAAGHQVYAPTLSGLADRAHLLTRDIGLDTHIKDIEGLLNYEDLTGVVLVGHSSGGMVISGVAALVPGRLAHLVYLDAAVPRPGQSLLDEVDSELKAQIIERVRTKGDGWKLPVIVTPGAPMAGVSNDADLRWMTPRLTPHPFRTWQDPMPPGSADVAGIPRTYISCTVEQGRLLAETAAKIRGI